MGEENNSNLEFYLYYIYIIDFTLIHPVPVLNASAGSSMPFM